MNSRMLAIAMGLALTLFAWIGLFSSGGPTLYCPMPAMTVLPAFALLSFGMRPFAAVLVPMVLFFLWNPGLVVHHQTNLPKRTIGVVVLLSVLTVVDFVLEWKLGLQYRGARHTVIIYGINAVWLGALWWALLSAWRRPAFRTNLLAHWILFAWLGWYAFAYLGELP
jgi:hypothetical protein